MSLSPDLEPGRKRLMAAKGHYRPAPPQALMNLPLLFMYILHKK